MTKQNRLMLRISLLSLLPVLAGPVAAADNNNVLAATSLKETTAARKASFRAPSAIKSDAAGALGESDIVFSAAPREAPGAAMEIYQPVADYLSQVLGRKVVFKYPGTWGVYRTEMLKGGYDIVFDGPHFNSYRMEKMQHNVIVKLPGEHVFAVIVRKDNSGVTGIKQLAGRSVCAHAPPNLGTLTLLSQFDNPSRQPAIVSTDGWKNIYQGVVSGKCTAGVLPLGNLKKFDAEGMAKVIHKEKALPNLAFSISPRLSTAEQAKIANALISPAASGATEKLRKSHNVEKLIQTNNQEYAGLAEYLKNEWGYY